MPLPRIWLRAKLGEFNCQRLGDEGQFGIGDRRQASILDTPARLISTPAFEVVRLGIFIICAVSMDRYHFRAVSLNASTSRLGPAQAG
jgi:hypothetical protein